MHHSHKGIFFYLSIEVGFLFLVNYTTPSREEKYTEEIAEALILIVRATIISIVVQGTSRSS